MHLSLRTSVLACSALTAFSAVASPSSQFTCPQTSSHSTGPDCHCSEENDCYVSVTIVPGSQPAACGTCTWTYSYTITCPGGCAQDGDSGSVFIDCTPHERNNKQVKVKCPVGSGYDDWLVLNFGCGYCQ